MPFWWRRRRKPWYGRFKRRWRRRTYKTRRRRFPRRRNRRATRRRRKRKYKVRRKNKRITIKQWNPESIKKCKIKLFGTLVAGAQGRQMFCYTNETSQYIQPKAPGGGGFGTEVITLQYLYQQYKARNCIWTTTNQYTDLCRYTGCKITLYRHPTMDFIFQYNLQPPFTIEKFTYQDLQPQTMLLHPHHKVILSKSSKPNGKLRHTYKIKPPKELSTKWFFQRDFSHIPLVQLSASVADLQYPTYGYSNASQMLTIFALNGAHFYKQSTWGQFTRGPYKPYETMSTPFTFRYFDSKGVERLKVVGDYTGSPADQYSKSVSRTEGWFQSPVLFSVGMVQGKYENIQDYKKQPELGTHPIVIARYNPLEDDGGGNEVWLTSILNGAYNKPEVTPNYLIQGLPLPLAFFGYWNMLIETSNDKGIMHTHMFVVKCKAIRPTQVSTGQDYYPIIDEVFAQGKLPYDETILESDSRRWYPTAEKQIVTLNSIVQAGPYIPRLENIRASTWELRYKLTAYFKWGGPKVTDPPIDDPHNKGEYPTPGLLQKTIQISNPEKQDPESLFHEWDYRRGFITQAAIKRMSENLQTDTSFESDDSETPKKKRKISKCLPCLQQKEDQIKACLQTLCEESICQETSQDLQQLIHQQQQQQHKLKRSILQLLTDLRKKQRLLGLQTGMID
nr:MAG: ORF1 [Torque teno midi virus]